MYISLSCPLRRRLTDLRIHADFSRHQITESLKHFGLGAATTSLVLVHITSDESAAPEGVLSMMCDLAQMEPISLDRLGRLPDGGTNEKSLRKAS